MTDLTLLDATAQAALVRSGEVAPTELVQAAINRIERVDSIVNAVVIPLHNKALEAANAVKAGDTDVTFPGVPVVVKDTVPTAGDPWHRGMRLLYDRDNRARFDAHVVGRMRSAGMAIVGKANVPELEGGISTEPALYGMTRNPWDLGRTVGGSSGGAAAAVAAGLVPLALGVDGGGSIRIPASICGVVGLKPSRGRTSLFPMYTEEGLSTAGPIARSVRDCASALDAMSGAPAGDHFAAPPPARPFAEEVGADPGTLRVGVWSPVSGGVTAEPDCLRAVEEAARLLDSLGHAVHVSHPVELDSGFFRRPEFLITAACYIAFQTQAIEREIGRFLNGADMEAVTWAATSAGAQVTAPVLQEAYAYNRRAAVRYASWFDETGSDLLLTPTIAVPPFPLGSLAPASPDAPWPDIASWVPFTPHANMAGLPAISLPLHWSAEGLPVGVQLVAPFGREDVLIRVASQLEIACPWADRRPTVHASR